MKILLFGKTGQVGHELLRTLAPLGTIIAPDRHEADFEDKDALQEILKTHAADVIVNAAAYNSVDLAEAEEEKAFRINTGAVEVLADYAHYHGSLLVHYSTDYVFDGRKTLPYVETDVPNPLNAYGRSKLAGEKAVQQAGCHHFIFRTSWVYSVWGQNFIKTIWRLAKERETLDVVADQTGAPTSAELIADVTALSVAAFFANLLPEGMYHLTASGETSWHGLASHVLEKALEKGLSLKLLPSAIRPVTTEDYPLPAIRPRNSRLDNMALSEKMGFLLPEWPCHVDRVIEQLIQADSAS